MIDIEWPLALVGILAALFALFAIGLPIAFSLGLVGFFGLFLLAGPKIATDTVSIFLYSVPTKFTLSAVPLFILMAEVMIFTGIAKDLFDSMEKLFSGLPTALPLATIAAGAFMGAVTGPARPLRLHSVSWLCQKW